jgi:hypothetical protein
MARYEFQGNLLQYGLQKKKKEAAENGEIICFLRQFL